MKRYAIIKENIVDNIILWDGYSNWEPPQGTFLVQLPEDARVSVGDIMVGLNEFVSAEEPNVPS